MLLKVAVKHKLHCLTSLLNGSNPQTYLFPIFSFAPSCIHNSELLLVDYSSIFVLTCWPASIFCCPFFTSRRTTQIFFFPDFMPLSARQHYLCKITAMHIKYQSVLFTHCISFLDLKKKKKKFSTWCSMIELDDCTWSHLLIFKVEPWSN